MPSKDAPLVAVVGSANLDVVMTVPRLPAPGETVLGDDVVEVAGGKGLNQAVAAGRHGRAALVARVGDDDAGRLLRTALRRAGVDAAFVLGSDAPTGRAFIEVADDGENRIVVVAGANSRLAPEEVRHSLAELRPGVVLAQLEVPVETVVAAAEWARDSGCRFVLNPSPVAVLPAGLLELCDPLVVNVGEAAALAGLPAATEVGVLAHRLVERAASVVVTDGPRGACIARGPDVQRVPGRRVTAVDTTGAGDEFAGRLAAALASGVDLGRAAELANDAAAAVVSLPRSER